ncbi:MAG TPA: hypothetical protein VNM14_24965 [Planctomycetota bacterium]|jgi:hypothetical protein|nr:hypothetical protein [Planctomycetota bacterium]
MSRVAALILLALAQDTAAPRSPAWVDGRIVEVQPTAEERKFDTIAWVPSIMEALRLAKQHSRPIMMFTYDGQIQTGRC